MGTDCITSQTYLLRNKGRLTTILRKAFLTWEAKLHHTEITKNLHGQKMSAGCKLCIKRDVSRLQVLHLSYQCTIRNKEETKSETRSAGTWS
jgi:hypothetical protein